MFLKNKEQALDIFPVYLLEMTGVKRQEFGTGITNDTTFSIRVHHVNFNRRNIFASEVTDWGTSWSVSSQSRVSLIWISCWLRKQEGRHEKRTKSKWNQCPVSGKAARKEQNWVQNLTFSSLENMVLTAESFSASSVVSHPASTRPPPHLPDKHLWRGSFPLRTHQQCLRIKVRC